MRDRPRTSGQASKCHKRIMFVGVALVLLAIPTLASASGELKVFPEPLNSLIMGGGLQEGQSLVPVVLLVMTAFFFALVIPVNALVFKPIFQALDDREHRFQAQVARVQMCALKKLETAKLCYTSCSRCTMHSLGSGSQWHQDG